MSVSNKSCIITGAANGVGLAIARRFAEAGAQIVMTDIEEDKLTAEAEALVSDGYRAIAFAGDLRERLTIANLLSTTIDAYDRIDILVNASRSFEHTSSLDMDPDTLTDMFDQNVGANLRITQAVVRKILKMAKKSGNDNPTGAVVNVTSIAARRTLPQLTAYSVTTAALDQLTRSLAVAFADKGIRVNAIAIGSVMSTRLREALNEDADLRAHVIAATPAGRIGEAAEAAEAAIFLASEGASFVTGQILSVDGGRSLIDPLSMPAH